MGEFMVKRLYRKQQKNIRNIANNIINFFHKELKGKYVFTQKIVGSGSLGTMLVDDNGDYDIDYQILLTNRSKIDLSNATQIKNDFFNCLQSYKDKEHKNAKIENSTTSITYRCLGNGQNFHIDFVLIKTFPKNDLIIRRNIKKETKTKNEYTWNELPKYNEAYRIFKNWDNNKKVKFIDYLLPKKIKEKQKPENDPSKISSSQLFISEVYNYEHNKRNIRL